MQKMLTFICEIVPGGSEDIILNINVKRYFDYLGSGNICLLFKGIYCLQSALIEIGK